MEKISFVLAAVLLLGSVYYLMNPVNSKKRNSNISSDDTRQRLIEDFYNNGAVIIYHQPGNADDDPFKLMTGNLKAAFPWIKFKWIRDSEVTQADLQNNSIFLIGTYDSDSVLKKIADNVPVKFFSGGFLFHDKKYSNVNSTINILCQNPFNKQKALYLIAGAKEFYSSKNSGLRIINGIGIFSNGMCEAMELFKQNENDDLVPDESTYRNFNDEKKSYSFDPVFNYTVYSKELKKEFVKNIFEKDRTSLEKLNDFFNDELEIRKADVFLYDNFEDKGLICRDTRLENISPHDQSVHTVINNWINGDDFFSIAESILLKNSIASKNDFLDAGFAMHFSNNWRGKGYEFWAAYIASSGNIHSLNEMLDNDSFPFISNLISYPLAGTFVDFLIDKIGKEKIISILRKPVGSKEEIEKLIAYEIDWKKYLNRLVLKYKNEIEKLHNNFAKNISSFQKGFCFAHEGYEIYNGYLSREALSAVEKMKRLGANSFSITPFTSMRNASIPQQLRFWQFSGAENDESLIYLSHAAKKLNMSVMLKPHIYLGSESWPGDIKMKNDKDWKLFFHFYFNWISHYAMLAEMYGIPMLCIGNELSAATVGHGKAWEDIIKKIRKMYDGKITYGANWSDEFEKVSFWKDLDYIGLSEYFPLSSKDNPSNADLLNGAFTVMNKIDAVAKKYDKPVIFTEVGFRSTAEPWKTALETNGRDKINLVSQAQCYKAIFKAAFNNKWLVGMYWWKWPSYLTFGGSTENNLYTPNNKPAEDVVEEWYLKNWK